MYTEETDVFYFLDVKITSVGVHKIIDPLDFFLHVVLLQKEFSNLHFTLIDLFI